MSVNDRSLQENCSVNELFGGYPKIIKFSGVKEALLANPDQTPPRHANKDLEKGDRS